MRIGEKGGSTEATATSGLGRVGQVEVGEQIGGDLEER